MGREREREREREARRDREKRERRGREESPQKKKERSRCVTQANDGQRRGHDRWTRPFTTAETAENILRAGDFRILVSESRFNSHFNFKLPQQRGSTTERMDSPQSRNAGERPAARCRAYRNPAMRLKGLPPPSIFFSFFFQRLPHPASPASIPSTVAIHAV